jgi:hypothetical protein
MEKQTSHVTVADAECTPDASSRYCIVLEIKKFLYHVTAVIIDFDKKTYLSSLNAANRTHCGHFPRITSTCHVSPLLSILSAIS